MTAKAKEKRVAFHGFTTDELGAEGKFCGYESFNCDCFGGRLTTAVGSRLVEDAYKNPISMPSTAKAKRFFQGVVKTETGDLEKVYFFVGENGGVTMFQSGKGWIVLDSITPIECITMRQEEHEVWNVLLSATGVYVVKEFGKIEKVLEIACRAGCCVGERVFYGCQNGEIVYSKPCAPASVTESVDDGGLLVLPVDAGEIMAMKGIGNSVYAFCEHAIYKIIAQAKASEFVIRRIPYAGGRIVRNGVGALGDRLVILAEDGAYILRDGVVEKGYEGLRFGRILTEQGAEYGCFEEKIVFSYDVRERVANVRRTVTLYGDGKHGFFGDSYIGLSGGEKGVFFMKGLMMACFGGSVETFNTAPYFRARTTDFGVGGRKRLKKMRLYGTGEATLVVETEQGERAYAIAFENGVAEVRLSESGFAFAFSFQPRLGCVLDGADVEFLYAEE